jgi:transposase
MEETPKARRGYSRDGRPDCLQVVIALVITSDGFPVAYEVMNGNTADCTTLRGFLDKIEQTYGKAKRMRRCPTIPATHIQRHALVTGERSYD